MRILVVGSGGREHALAWRLGRGHPPGEDRQVLCAPGNAGIARDAECVPVKADDVEGLVRLARERAVDLVVVGPEQPLMLGLVDRLTEAGIPAFGPSAAAAALEGSKTFAKEIMLRAEVPTADWRAFDDPHLARTYARELGGRVAVKADGLAAGKGVILCHGPDESDAAVTRLMDEGAVGDAGHRVVVEALLEGEEASFIALCDGTRVLPLAGSQDHKAAFDGDAGPNTGGMGAVSPTPCLDEATTRQVMDQVMKPVVLALAESGRPFRGALYAGLMLTAEGPKVLEFNVRFGNPETQALMLRLESDLAPVLLAAANGDLSDARLVWDRRPAVCVVVASGGYPGPYEVGAPITGLAELDAVEGLQVFHAGTATDADERVITAGGRVLGVTALGDDVGEARRRAYEAVGHLHFDGAFWRRDIGARALGPRSP